MATTYSFNENIPAANNNPSADQPIMQTNNASTKSIIGVDHVTFGTATGGAGSSDGQHLQVTFNDKHPPATPVDPIAVVSTDDGLANATHPQLYYDNSQGNFPLSAVRAFGNFTTVNVNGAVSPSNQANVSSITASSGGNVYTVALNANAVNGNNVVVLLTVNSTQVITALTPFGYSFTNPNLVITGNGLSVFAGVAQVNFLVLQI